MKSFKKILPLIDLLISPMVCFLGHFFKGLRWIGLHKLPISQKILLKIGVFPIVDHYYEPLFNTKYLKYSLSNTRILPGIDWNEDEQLKVLNKFSFGHEIENLPIHKINELQFYMKNGTFEAGDAEYWYNMIRYFKPKKIFEIGSGNSTLMAIMAIKKNREEDIYYSCHHVCIEPFEQPWLEESGVEVIRKKVENIDLSFFEVLCENDILFIDSSHVIRPQGDVVFEYIHLLPRLNKGVIVHIHDIFSPRDYPEAWFKKDILFWNEQYILEAFLTSNKDWEIIGAVNYLHKKHFTSLKKNSPFLTPELEPGSFYLKKIN